MDESLSTDINLMLKVKSGDVDKLGLLYERHKRKLFGYFYKSTRDKDISEDLVHTVFLRILNYRTKFSGYGKFATWMFFIAHNVLIDHFRKNKKYQLSQDSMTDEIDREEKVEEKLVRNEEFHLLQKAIDRLDSAKREILVLSKLKEMKYKDIAKILDCTEGNVRIRVFRALSELKEIYLKMEAA